jgi:hypothetical protein
VLRSAALFFALAADLAWSELRPAANPFEAIYNRLIGPRKGYPPLTAAPGPRRFAQGLAAALLLMIAVSLLAGWPLLAGAVATLLFAAIAAILLRGFCFGSFVFHLLTGNAAFARRTMPWSRGG